MDQLENEFVRHESCPDCGSSELLLFTSDGHTYCFSCNTRTRSPDDSEMPVSGTHERFQILGDFQRLKKGIYQMPPAADLRSRTIAENCDSTTSTEIDR